MITLTLLHPVQSTPVQSWTFEQDPVIQIGRAVDNHVVLYSAVVSRYHVELRQTNHQWEVVNLGTNGTYLDGKRVNQAALTDGSIMRLARSGPNIQIRIDTSQPSPPRIPSEEEPTADLQPPGRQESGSSADTLPPHVATQEVLDPSQTLISPEDENLSNANFQAMGHHAWLPRSSVREQGSPLSQADQGPHTVPLCKCPTQRSATNALLCIDCGLPLTIQASIGAYHVLKASGTRGQRFVAWREGHIVALKALNEDPIQSAATTLEDLAKRLCQLNHPGIPKIYEAFAAEGQIFLVSEMIYGQTLKQYIAGRGALTQSQAVAWMIDICHSLHYLHQQSPPIFHRSLHPGNLIRPTIPHGLSQVVLVDFGDAPLPAETDPAVNQDAYVAPVQHISPLTPAADLYAVGTTLIYLLTQQEPDTFSRLGDQEQHFCVEEIPNISQEMATIIQKLTASKPEERYASVESVIKALEALI